MDVHTIIQHDALKDLLQRLSDIEFLSPDEQAVPSYYAAILENLAAIPLHEEVLQKQRASLIAAMKERSPRLGNTLHEKEVILPFATPFEHSAHDDAEGADTMLESALRDLRTPLRIMRLQTFIRDQLVRIHALSSDGKEAYMSEYWGPTHCGACAGVIAIPRKLYFMQTLYDACMQRRSANPEHRSLPWFDISTIRERLHMIADETYRTVMEICDSLIPPTPEQVEAWHFNARNVFIESPYGNRDELLKRLRSKA